jgi:hypothetical protein
LMLIIIFVQKKFRQTKNCCKLSQESSAHKVG